MPIRERLRAVPMVGWMVLVALAIRLIVIPFDTIENLMDANHIHAWEQGNVARALVSGHGFGSPFISNQPSAVMPPVFPLIVAVFFLLFGVHTAKAIFAIHAFDCLVSAVATIPIYMVARRTFGARIAMRAAWAWVFFPYGVYFSAAWAWSTHLLLLCICVLLYLAAELEVSAKPARWLAFGAVAGLGGLTEPSVLVVTAFLMAFAMWRLARAGLPWFSRGCMAALALVAVLSPWLIREELVFHRFIPIRDSIGLELWMGNNGYTQRWTSDQMHPLHDAAELAAYDAGEVPYMAMKRDQAVEYIKGHPRWYAVMCVRRAVYLWTGYWSLDKDYLDMEPTDVANIPFASTMTLLGMLGLWLLWREKPFEGIRFGGVLFVFPMIYYFTHPEAYHMRPVDPLLVILGTYAVLRLRAGMRNSSVAEAVPAAA